MARLGHNRGFIDELYASYRSDPSSVSEAWRDFFKDYRPEPEHAAAVDAAAEATAPGPRQAAAPPPGAPPTGAAAAAARPLRGAAARIAENMIASLTVPTATSARTMPVKVLEENRRILNQHQALVAGRKISFTHLVAWAVVQAVARHRRMNVRFVEREGRPHREEPPQVHLGIAIDAERSGERLLVVPNIKGADALDFPAFVESYDDLVARARANRLELADFEGTTITLTNPGMLGTALSVPRLMQGQGLIVGVGSIGYPPECAGMAPAAIAELGLSRIMTITSTYDHRVIQGAESGAFLADLERLLAGDEEFYGRIFSELRVPHVAVGWSQDRHPALGGTTGALDTTAKQAGVMQLIRSFRVRGHLLADLDPLGYEHEPNAELELATYGLSIWDLDRAFLAGGLAGQQGPLTLREILDTLEQTYCQHVGAEYMHIQDSPARHWLQARMESTRNAEPLPRDWQLRILHRLNAAEAFEQFLGTAYVGQKRFSLEGAETLIPMLDAVLHDVTAAGMDEVIIGMTHRGRLNVLANIVGKSARQIFREFEGDIDPQTAHGSGDVKYHLGATGIHAEPGVGQVRVMVASNPSHLEAVDPVVEGLARAHQDLKGDAGQRVLPVLLHGDAAFSGQGVVAETLNLSQLKGYQTGGTLHIIVNNQIGFTTGPADLRSSPYPTDVAKGVQAPIFHVNGDHPEDAVRVVRLALAFRQEFRRDVVVDLVCYRRWGHNEADDPSYTHPLLYAKIQQHRSVRKLHTERLLRRGDLDRETAEGALEDFSRRLREVHDQVRQALTEAPDEPWETGDDERESQSGPPPATAVASEAIERIFDALERTPAGFHVHPKLAQQRARRREQFTGRQIDWGLGEALAFGSLLIEGVPIRLSGEDSGRGTFSQRHATLYDHRTAEPYVPLAHLDPGQAPFASFDSLLSEFAVLGFEYGYSVGHPRALVLWEAQFGDFCNGAQVIIDQFLVSAEDKWNQRCGLVLLLPHGYEGQGPEHSSARLERFLQLAARGNMRITYPSTPAQYFHLLRSQARIQDRRPLVVLTPKSLLRHKACVSRTDELTHGSFQPLLSDPLDAAGAPARRIVLCSGKIAYDLQARRDERGRSAEVVICRLEQLYPFPLEELAQLLRDNGSARELLWVQEEPQNMGAWSFVRERIEPLIDKRTTLRYVGRPRAASPATGSHRRHVADQQALVDAALDDRSPAVDAPIADTARAR